MTICEFAKLSRKEKASKTWNGTFLAHRERDNIKYALYSVENFFLEVAYRSADYELLGFNPSQTNRLIKDYRHYITLEF